MAPAITSAMDFIWAETQMISKNITLTGLGAAMLIFSFSSAQAAGFDGRWEFVLTTTVGTCEKTLPGAFAVRGLDIDPDSKSPLKAAGALEKNGSMWSRLSAGEHVYRIQGRFRGAGASGAWSSGSRYCGGNWHASRMR